MSEAAVRAIFFDLETSDKEPIGQILNYSFIAVDESLSIVSECSGDIRLSRLQVPSPDAILKNRVDVLALQQSDALSEIEAMQRIVKFVQSAQTSSKKPPVLIGYNSNKFDIPRLRTSMIRNGINPYFGGNVVYRDILLAVRKLSISDAAFPRPLRRQAAEVMDQEGGELLSLSLEDITTALGILDQEQTHHSRDDVLLTIDLARHLREKFALEVLSYNPFEIEEACEQWKAKEGEGLFWALSPEYQRHSKSLSRRQPCAFLCASHRSLLIIDLDRFLQGEGRRSIRWINRGTTALYHGGALSADFALEFEAKHATAHELASQAREEFKKLTPDNFFEKSTCDIEQDIYRIDMKGISTLGKAVQEKDAGEVKKSSSRDLKILFARHRLANAPLLDDSGKEMLKKYALHRYGGSLQLSKTGVPESATSQEPGDDARHVRFHPTLQSYLDRIQALLENRERLAPGDSKLLLNLKAYILDSEIVEVAGNELLRDSFRSDRAA